MSRCENCGYEAPGAPERCPKCGARLSAPEAGSPPPPVGGGRKTIAIADFQGIGGSATPRFELVLEKQQRTLAFEGSDVLLNRDNVDKDNPSISGAAHARLTFENGRWQITDLSSNGATFVQVNGTVPIQDGDLVILGQTVFRFKSET